MLKDVAGFQQFRRSDSRSANPSAQGVTLRALGGNASSRALVLLDGVPMADPFFGYIPFTALSPDRLSGVRDHARRRRGRVRRGRGRRHDRAGQRDARRSAARVAAAPSTAARCDRASRQRSRPISAAAMPRRRAGANAATASSPRPPTSASPPTCPRALSRLVGQPARRRADRRRRPKCSRAAWSFGDDRTLRFAGGQHFGGAGRQHPPRPSRRWQVDALAYVQARNFTQHGDQRDQFPPDARPAQHALDRDRRQDRTAPAGRRGPCAAHRASTRGSATASCSRTPTAPSPAWSPRGATPAGAPARPGCSSRTTGRSARLMLTGGARVDRWTITDGFFREAQCRGQRHQRPAASPTATAWQATGRAGAVFDASDARRAARRGLYRLPPADAQRTVPPVRRLPGDDAGQCRAGSTNCCGVEVGVDLTPAAPA